MRALFRTRYVRLCKECHHVYKTGVKIAVLGYTDLGYVLLWFLQNPPASPGGSQALANAQLVADIAQSLVTAAGIIVAGVWAYYRFFKGRVFRMRLEPEISGKATCHAETIYLTVVAQLKNVGLTKVDLPKGEASVLLASYDAYAAVKDESTVEHIMSQVHTVIWDHITAFDVFKQHFWIEPGELIEDKLLIAVPKHQQLAFRLQLRVGSNKITWEAIDMVSLMAEDDGNEISEIPTARSEAATQ